MPLLSMSLNYILVVYINLDNCQIWFLYPCLKNQTMTQIVLRIADEKLKNLKEEERNKEKSKKQ